MQKDPNAPPFSDAAVLKRTGRTWQQWCELLDSRQAMSMSHTEVAALVNTLHGAGGWWSQGVTVGYERLRGKRQLAQKGDGSFTATASKTLPVEVEVVREWLTRADRRRRWAPPGLTLVPNRSARGVRIRDAEGRPVDAWLQPKEDGRTTLAIEVRKLAGPDQIEPAKALWKQALERLHALTSQSD